MRVGRYREAEPLFQEALSIYRDQFGDSSAETLRERDPNVATSLNNLASLYQAQGRYKDAEPLYQESLSIWREALNERHPDVALSLNNLAVKGCYQGHQGIRKD